MFSMIVAMDKNNSIGYKNNLLFHYKKDMDYFKDITSTVLIKDKINAVVVGRKTFESIPNKFKPLKNRINIIMSKKQDKINELNILYKDNDNVIILSSINDVLSYIKSNKNIEKTFIIGGSIIYNQFLQQNIINNLYITVIDKVFEKSDTKCNIYNINNYELIKTSVEIDNDLLNNNEENVIEFNYYRYNNKEEKRYIKIMNKILNKGIYKDDRTGTGTLSIFGKRFKYNVRNGIIPLFTTKKVFFKGAAEELLWFISGSTDVRKLQEKKVKIWDGNSTRSFLDNRGLHHLKEGDIGACFPENTLILTKIGYKKIQDIILEDKLYTHQGDWRTINNIQKSKYNKLLYTFKIKYCSKPIICTDNHPILIKENKRDLNEEPKWCRAYNIKKKYYMGFKKNNKRIMPTFNNINMYDNNLWFVLGYLMNYLDDIDDYGNIIFKIIDKDMFYILKKLSTNIDNITKNINNTYTINIDNYSLLNEFKNGIPEWVQDTNTSYIKDFLQGYYMSNIINTNEQKILVKSYSIALQLQRLYFKIDIFISINDLFYQIKKKINKINNTNYIWFSIEEIQTNQTEDLDIYNFEIDVDNSYTVQNISVHNSYGHQLRHFNAKYTNCEDNYKNKGVDQLQYCIDLIKTDPDSRRIIFCYWNPEQLNEMALYPCHLMYQFYVDKYKNEISCSFYQRSCDSFLGLPFNVTSATLLLNMVCHLTNYKPGDIIHNIGDIHIYSNHILQSNEIINRIPSIFPKIKINRKERKIENINDFEYTDFELINYYPQSSIKAPMAI